MITKSKCDPVAARAMHRTLLDWNNAIRAAFKMSHDQSAAARSRTEDERDFLPETPGKLSINVYWNEQRRRNRAARFAQSWRKLVQQRRLLRSELLRIRQVLDAAAAADPKMTTSHTSLSNDPLRVS